MKSENVCPFQADQMRKRLSLKEMRDQLLDDGVVVHTGVITALAQVFVWPLNDFRQGMTGPTTLTALMPMPG